MNINGEEKRALNRAALKTHALACSKAFRAGKFTRMGEDFVAEVEADVEEILRDLKSKRPTQLHEPFQTCVQVVTGELKDALAEIFNDLVLRIIQNKVQAQPSCGCTLGRTR